MTHDQPPLILQQIYYLEDPECRNSIILVNLVTYSHFGYLRYDNLIICTFTNYISGLLLRVF